MPYHLTYNTKSKEIKRTFSSFYEFVRTKEGLRRKGIPFEERVSGVDVGYTPAKTKLGQGTKNAIRNFLEMCDNIGDYKNSKRYGQWK